MPTATIEVKRNFRPETSKFGQGGIVTPDGTKYDYPPAMASQFEDGGVYEIFFETTPKGYHKIKTAKPGSVLAGAVTQIVARTQASPMVAAPRQDPQSENIFVAGAFNHAIGAGQIDLTAVDDNDIGLIVSKLRSGYRKGSALSQGNGAAAPAKAGQQYDPEMRDEIPFSAGV